MDTKICSKCGKEKEIEKFVKDKNKKKMGTGVIVKNVKI